MKKFICCKGFIIRGAHWEKITKKRSESAWIEKDLLLEVCPTSMRKSQRKEAIKSKPHSVTPVPSESWRNTMGAIAWLSKWLADYHWAQKDSYAQQPALHCLVLTHIEWPGSCLRHSSSAYAGTGYMAAIRNTLVLTKVSSARQACSSEVATAGPRALWKWFAVRVDIAG